MKINTVWNKLPSVTREGKFFYRGKHNSGEFFTVLKSWVTGQWNVQGDFSLERFKLSGIRMATFKTSKAAMSAVDNL